MSVVKRRDFFKRVAAGAAALTVTRSVAPAHAAAPPVTIDALAVHAAPARGFSYTWSARWVDPAAAVPDTFERLLDAADAPRPRRRRRR